MKFIKKHLADIKYCYSVSTTVVDGRKKVLFAPDAPGPCIGFDSETFEQENVWEYPGGTMSMVQIPGRNGDFLAVQKFNPGFNAADAEIVIVKKTKNGWETLPWIKLPYVHRFDILQREDRYYLICCTVCSSKKSIDDWSSPGGIYVASIDIRNIEKKPVLTEIKKGLTRNHGYCHIDEEGYSRALISSDQGVFAVTPPDYENGEWTIDRIIEAMVSDISITDIDGDGKNEIACIEPFHGTEFVVYHEIDNGYEEFYRYPTPMSFIHVSWGGRLVGENVFIGGCREKDRELFILRWNGQAIEHTIIEKGFGPSNVEVITVNGKEVLAVANREKDEAAVFFVEKDK